MDERDSNKPDVRGADLTLGTDVAAEAVFLPPDTTAILPEGDVRQAAEHAAMRAGLSIEAWIERAIHRCATEELGDIDLPVPVAAVPQLGENEKPGAATTPSPAHKGVDATEARLNILEKRFEAQLAAQTEHLQNLIAKQGKTENQVAADTKQIDNSTLEPDLVITDHDNGEIQTLLHEYFGVLLPSAQRIETVMQQLDVLLDRSVDYRDLNGFLKNLAADSERTTSALIPLEKAITRLAENKLPASSQPFREPPARPLPGGSGISRLFRGQE